MTAQADECLKGLRPALIAGDFSGSVDCLHDSLSVRKIGTLGVREREFTVYDYRYKLAPVCDDCSIHGGQRVLIFDRGRYLGQYKPYKVRITVEQGRLWLWPIDEREAPQAPVKVVPSSSGFPNEILVDGEVLSFFR
ncbi:hypothetical protein WBP07_14595 [Novosphingobium sp. BL-8A]|uniref:hypothetical protein n=1 Tax=Novosphingobium sp. BL-8A TaxID=3127639 RepID=UPI0037579655